MQYNYVEVLGYVAATLTTSSFIPQIARILKTKSTKDISLGMFTILCSGLFLWLIYGLFIKSFPIIIANCLALIFNLTVIAYKLKYK